MVDAAINTNGTLRSLKRKLKGVFAMTVLFESLENHLQKKRLRMHMPGHKGNMPYPFSQCAPYDLTELPDTGSLLEGKGPVAETERRFEEIYQSGATLLSASGSTLCIQKHALPLLPRRFKCFDGQKQPRLGGKHCRFARSGSNLAYPDRSAGSTRPDAVTPRRFVCFKRKSRGLGCLSDQPRLLRRNKRYQGDF